MRVFPALNSKGPIFTQWGKMRNNRESLERKENSGIKMVPQ